MKSKNTIAAAAAIVMSATFAAGLAACGGGNGGNNGNDDGDYGHSHNYNWVADPDGRKCHEECDGSGDCDVRVKPSREHVDDKNNTTNASGEDGKCDRCGTTMPAEDDEEDMTEDDWEAAFELGTQYAFREVIKGEDFGEMSVYAEVDGDKIYLEVSAGVIDRKFYVETVGEKLYLYTTTYEYWTKAETTSDMVNLGEVEDIVDNLKTTFPFDKFEKGTDEGEYVSKQAYVIQAPDGEGGTVDTTISDATLKFADGKIVSTAYKVEGQLCEVTFEYGKTVTLPEVLEGEQVTQEEWTAALAMNSTNYRMNTSLMGLTIAQFKQDGMKKQFSTAGEELGGGMQDYYLSKEGNAYYQYFRYYGHWMKGNTDYSSDEEFAGYNGFTAMGIHLEEYPFNAFTYDEESKTYVLQGETTLFATFSDKKLVCVTVIDGNGINSIEIVYGDAEVTLPAIPEGEQVSDAEWAVATEMDFDNFEIYTVITGMGEIEYKKVGSTLYQKMTDERGSVLEEVYLTVEGGKYYIYEIKEGKWTKEEAGKEDYDKYLPAFLLNRYNALTFEWDEGTKTYKGANDQPETVTFTTFEFVDKKLYTISDASTKMYFSYGSAALTVPEEGSPANNGENQGNVNIGTEVREGMTEKEWEDAINATVNAANFTVRGGFMNDDNITSAYFNYFDIDNGVIYRECLMGADDDADELYVVDETGTLWLCTDDGEGGFDKSRSKYSSMQVVHDALAQEIMSPDGLSIEVGAIIDNYAKFKFVEEGVYKYDVTENEHIIVCFGDGKVVSVSYGNSSADNCWERVYEFSDYGETSDFMPDWYENGETV